MKMYPQDHDIVSGDILKIKDIPLSYIDASNDIYTVSQYIYPDFQKESFRKLQPYDEYEKDSMLFFDKEGNIIRDLYLKRSGNRYYYEPESAREFSPETFTSTITLKRNGHYNAARKYDIKVAAYNQPMENMLMSLFEKSKDMRPKNISVNSGNTSEGAMTFENLGDADIVFFESPDGNNYIEYTDENENGKLVPIPYTDILKKHTNIWISADKFGTILTDITEGTVGVSSIYLKKIDLYTQSVYKTETKDIIRSFYSDSDDDDYVINSVIYKREFLADSILVFTRNGYGSIIVTPKELLTHAENFPQVIYEMMMYVMLNGYIDLKTPETWITSSPVDYISYQKEKFGRNHRKINLDRILMENMIPDKDDYVIYNVKCSPAYVMFSGMDQSRDLYYTKLTTTGTPDPDKETYEISYYTTKGTVLYYKSQDIYELETRLNVTSKVNSDNTIYITADPIKSTKYNIRLDKPVTLKVPDNKKNYRLCTRPVTQSFESELYLISKDKSPATDDEIVLADININCLQKPKLYDIRIMGGGLPEQMDDDYDLMDIGHPNGRPYRIGGTMIIRLPKRYEKYKEKIQDAVEKHISSGDYPIIIYMEDDEEI